MLRIFGETSEKWYYDETCSRFKTFKYMLDEIEQLLLRPASQSMQGEDVLNTNTMLLGEDDVVHNDFYGFLSEKKMEIDLVKKYFVLTKKYEVDEFYQSMFRHLGVFNSLFEILKDDLESTNKSMLTMSHIILIERIYFIFAFSCINNATNQDFFKGYLK